MKHGRSKGRKRDSGAALNDSGAAVNDPAQKGRGASSCSERGNASGLEKVPSTDLENVPFASFEGVTVRFDGKTVIDDLSFSLDGPGIYLLEGPSGSGKTTVLRVLAGLENAYEGKRFVNGKVSVIFQEPRLFEDFSVLENVMLAVDPKKRGVTRREAEAVCAGILGRLGLGAELSKKAGECSGGMKQRVAAARALAAEPDVLLADEPFSALDEDNRRTEAELLAEISSSCIVLIATHGGEGLFGEEAVKARIRLDMPG